MAPGATDVAHPNLSNWSLCSTALARLGRNDCYCLHCERHVKNKVCFLFWLQAKLDNLGREGKMGKGRRKSTAMMVSKATQGFPGSRAYEGEFWLSRTPGSRTYGLEQKKLLWEKGLHRGLRSSKTMLQSAKTRRKKRESKPVLRVKCS